MKKRTVIFFVQSAGRHELRRREGVYAFAEEHDWHVLVIERTRQLKDLPKLLRFWKPAGCIAEGVVEATGLSPIVRSGVPLVFCDVDPIVHLDPKWKDRAGFVIHDAPATTQLAFSELMKTTWNDLAFVGGVEPKSWSSERLMVFRELVRASGRRGHEFSCEMNGPFADVMDFQRRLQAWLDTLPKPCAILAANDFMGEQVILACRDLGIPIPQQVLLVGVDNDELRCEHVKPSLSSVEPDFREAGRTAAKLLDEMVRGRAKGGVRCAFGPVQIVRRQSSTLLRQPDASVQAALETIRRRACDGLGAADVLEAMGGSRSRAERLFRQTTGCSVGEKIEERRMEEVVRLLSDPTLKIATVAAASGYKSGSLLRRRFHAKFGMSMQTWREGHGS